MFETEEFWNEKFRDENYYYGTEPNQFLKSHAKLFHPGTKLLSLGDGEGRNAVYLAKQGIEVTASDASSDGLKKLEKLATEENVKVVTRYEDIVLANWDNQKWDGIINIFCHLPREQRLIVYDKIKESLNPGGIFLTEMFSPEQLKYKSGGPLNIDMLISLEELTDYFSDFKILYAKPELIELNEGRHHGTGAVTRFIVQK